MVIIAYRERLAVAGDGEGHHLCDGDIVPGIQGDGERAVLLLAIGDVLRLAGQRERRRHLRLDGFGGHGQLTAGAFAGRDLGRDGVLARLLERHIDVVAVGRGRIRPSLRGLPILHDLQVEKVQHI